MSIRPPGARARRTYPPDQVRAQRQHELSTALEAARTLQARLEMLGDRQEDVRHVRLLRDALAHEMGVTDPIATSVGFPEPTSSSHQGTSLPGVLDHSEQDALTRQALIAEDEVGDGR